MIMRARQKHDVVVVGGGPAGAATALYLLSAGIKPLILEKDQFPRYHIGESLTGEAGRCLRELGLEPVLTKARCPVKRGVKVYGPSGQGSFWVPVNSRDENNKLQPATTWQVRRSFFDETLFNLAIERGADWMPVRAMGPLMEGDRVAGVRVRTPEGTTEDLQAEVVVDASGQNTFLASTGAPTSEKMRGRYDKQVAIYSQVVNAHRDPGEGADNTLIFYQKRNHWAWFIPLDEEVVSVGVVVPSKYFRGQGLSKSDFLLRELGTLNPGLTARIPEVSFVEDVFSASNYSYEIKQYTGRGFLCVGDSHRFIDPIFSFGLNFALREAQFASSAIARYLAGESRDSVNPFAAYQTLADRGQDIIQSLVDVFWNSPLPFSFLVHHKHREPMIDLFAGRIYDERLPESEPVRALRMCL